MTCDCNGNCNCKDEDYIYDESGFIIGKTGGGINVFDDYVNYTLTCKDKGSPDKNLYKYAEDKILEDLKKHLDATYSEHYATEEQGIECFDAWIAFGDSTPTFRNTALKYLWRYGKKNGNNKQDLMKALHYIFMCLYVDHYRKDEK